MPATTVYSTLFNSDGSPVFSRPRRTPLGTDTDCVTMTIATTSLDDVGDFVGLIPVPSGKRIQWLARTSADLDSGGGAALDLDVVIRTVDSSGTITDTLVYDASAQQPFSAAVNREFYVVTTTGGVLVPDDADSVGVLGLKVIAAASTAAAGAVTLAAAWQ